jgi:predicted alpha/beta-fold hydrolase
VSHRHYRAPLWLRNGHSLSIYPSLFRKIDSRFLQADKIETSDGDFLNLDWGYCKDATQPSNKLVILSHGLEGHSRRHYMTGMAKAVMEQGWDALGWNFRSCGGEMNRHLRFYHSGATEDLDAVIQYALKKGCYDQIALVGFSMGGNLSLVYLGERGEQVHPAIKKAAVFSVPCDLADSSAQLARPQNFIYMRRFLKSLKQKMVDKQKRFPDKIDLKGYRNIKNFKEFDDRYTAPIHGFKSAEHYWHSCSSKHFIEHIRVPTLIVNAKDDPFLGAACYPKSEVSKNPLVSLEIPVSGGHVGFVSFNPFNMYWSEQRVVQFLKGDEFNA